MEDTMLIQLTDKKAVKLLRDLEAKKIIKVIRENIIPRQKLSEKYRGSISKEEGEKLNKHIQESRNEWNRNI